MSEKSSVFSLSISARATLDLHSLNNEGGEGNQIQTRMVDIVDTSGHLQNVNAISGDMFKHIQSEHLYRIARGNRDLPLCNACQLFDANRICADQDFIDQIAGKSDAEAIDLMLHSCVLDDLEGNLITADRSTPRKSVVEFAWVVGIPDVTATGSYFHVKFAAERGEAAREAAREEATRKANLGQIPFNRPASSGIYAVVNHYEISRIGFNDISRRYALDEAARLKRYHALLESTLYTYLQPNGAMRSAQFPHLVAFEGVISYSTAVLPAPTVSPLNPNYLQEIKRVVQALDGLYPHTVILKPFQSLGEFAEHIHSLVEDTYPYSVGL